MSYGAEAADKVVNMAVDTSVKVTEESMKLAALGAKNLAALLLALVKGNEKLAGKAGITKLLEDGKQLAVVPIKSEELKQFATFAKEYGVLFTAIKDKTDTLGLSDLLVREEDAPKLNRIFERMGYGEKNELTNQRETSLQEQELNTQGKFSQSEQQMMYGDILQNDKNQDVIKISIDKQKLLIREDENGFLTKVPNTEGQYHIYLPTDRTVTTPDEKTIVATFGKDEEIEIIQKSTGAKEHISGERLFDYYSKEFSKKHDQKTLNEQPSVKAYIENIKKSQAGKTEPPKMPEKNIAR